MRCIWARAFFFFCYMQINKEANIVLINDSEDAKEDGK